MSRFNISPIWWKSPELAQKYYPYYGVNWSFTYETKCSVLTWICYHRKTGAHDSSTKFLYHKYKLSKIITNRSFKALIFLRRRHSYLLHLVSFDIENKPSVCIVSAQMNEHPQEGSVISFRTRKVSKTHCTFHLSVTAWQCCTEVYISLKSIVNFGYFS